MFDAIYTKERQCWVNKDAWDTPDVTLSQVECDPLLNSLDNVAQETIYLILFI